MSSLGEAKDFDLSVEDQLNARRGYTAAVSNPKISRKSKRNALDLLNDELDGDTPRHHLDEAPPDQSGPGCLGVLESNKRKSDNTAQSENGPFRLDQYPG